MLRPTDCIATDFNTKWYQKWHTKLQLPSYLHPKFWELAALAESLDNRGCLKSGKRGLGMGVGEEQLVSLFASMGVHVVATDQPVSEQSLSKWGNGQLTSGKDALFYKDIVSRKQFMQQVEYLPYDMNTKNDSFVDGFDFVWHNCVIGHLGSIEQAVTQLKRSADYLKDGGWLVFTTELNIASLYETIAENADTILWRISDIESLCTQMLEIGMEAEPLRIRLGETAHDTRINYNHSHEQPLGKKAARISADRSELKIPVGGFALTQVLLCFQKNPRRSRVDVSRFAQATRRNVDTLRAHLAHNNDLREYFTQYQDIQYADAQLVPETKQMHISLLPGETKHLSLRFLNRSDMTLFDYSLFTPYSKPPLVAATFNPINRSSIFVHNDWSSPNRPALAFTPVKLQEQPEWNQHRVGPDEWFEYTFRITAPHEPGIYTENFVLVFEGKTVVPASAIMVKIDVQKVTAAQKSGLSEKEIVSPADMLKRLGLKSSKQDMAVADGFVTWLGALAERQFRYRLFMRSHEFVVFLRAYVRENYPDYTLPKNLSENATRHQLAYIQINEPTANASTRTKLILVPSTPRVGGTVFSHLLGELTGWPRYTAAHFDMIDLAGLSGPTIVHMHITKDEFNKLTLPYPVQSIALARDPLDTLVSAFNFAQHNPQVVNWINLRVFAEPLEFTNKGADSPEFAEWALSEGAQNMLSVTPSWWDSADMRVTYEAFKQSPLETFRRILAVVDPGKVYTDQYIKDAVERIDREFLANAENKHRWNGSSGYGADMVPAQTVRDIRRMHHEVFETLGYGSVD